MCLVILFTYYLPLILIYLCLPVMEAHLKSLYIHDVILNMYGVILKV